MMQRFPSHLWRMACGLLTSWALAGPVAAQPSGQWIDVPSQDRTEDGTARVITAWFVPAAGDAPRPAVVLLHGCAGMRNRRGDVSAHIQSYATLLQQQGWHVLAPDSLTPRGERELCTQRVGNRRVTQVERRLDALGALRWLAVQPGVDANRLAVVGWSHGGSAVLAVTNARFPDARADDPVPRAAVAFYPGCGEERLRGYEPRAPLLMLLGERDDWTSPRPCQALASAAGAAPGVAVHTYPDAYHAFDSAAPLRLRTEVPGGVYPGRGVHVGSEPAARADAPLRLVDYLRSALTPAPGLPSM